MRRAVPEAIVGVGTPRGLQGRLAALIALIVTLWTHVTDLWRVGDPCGVGERSFHLYHCFEGSLVGASE